MTTADATIEDIAKRRKRLLFRSWHRGTKEMDLLLGSFADLYVPAFTESELAAYEALLECSDPDLYEWVTGQKPVPANFDGTILRKLSAHRFC